MHKWFEVVLTYGLEGEDGGGRHYGGKVLSAFPTYSPLAICTNTSAKYQVQIQVWWESLKCFFAVATAFPTYSHLAIYMYKYKCKVPVPVFVNLLVVVFLFVHVLECALACALLCLTWSEFTEWYSWMLRTKLFPLHLVNLSILGTSLNFHTIKNKSWADAE